MIDLAPILKRIPAEWGAHIAVGKGWHPIIVELNEQLAVLDPEYEVHQVKQKFGGLRYYCSLLTPEATGLIRAAEDRACVTCERCGQAGSRQSSGWGKVLCDACMLNGSDDQ